MGWVDIPSRAITTGADFDTPKNSNLVSLPIMPLNSVCLPSPSVELLMSEPRYIEMCDNILETGGRRYVVTFLRDGRLAEIGVVLHLDSLRHVSLTANGGAIKVAENSACQLARIVGLRNPSAWYDKSTYLRADVEILDAGESEAIYAAMSEDSTDAAASPPDKVCSSETEIVRRLSGRLDEIMSVQRALDQDLGIRQEVVSGQTFWQVCGNFSVLLSQRLQGKARKMNRELRNWMESNGVTTLNPDALPDEMRQKIASATEAYRDEREELQYVFQYILQSTRSGERITIIAGLLELERRRLSVERSLQGIASAS